MTFYLKPPSGLIPNHLFKLYAESRLRLLIALNKNRLTPIGKIFEENALEIPRLDALIEGSIKDRVSHFALREEDNAILWLCNLLDCLRPLDALALFCLSIHTDFLACVIHDPTMYNFIFLGERLLFRARLKECIVKDLESGIRALLQHLKQYIPYLSEILGAVAAKKYSEYFQAVSKILAKILRQELLNCIPDYVNNTEPRSTNICPHHGLETVLEVPFQQVLRLTSKLEVILVQGQAFLHCPQIPEYLEGIFMDLLQVSSETMKSTACLETIRLDPRLRETSNDLKRILESQGYSLPLSQMSPFSGERVHLVSLGTQALPFFPPCMVNLYNTLRANHRLCHQPRVQLTLFLKSVGLKVDDCLQLLEEEYSRPIAQTREKGGHKCEHSWQKDRSRYIYGTRHLYGLEGARKNYSCHNCTSIQKNTVSASCGGCPFVKDEARKLKILSEDLGGKSRAEEFASSVNFKDIAPIEACHKYLRFKLKCNRKAVAQSSEVTCPESKQNVYMISKPIDFYMRMKQLY